MQIFNTQKTQKLLALVLCLGLLAPLLSACGGEAVVERASDLENTGQNWALELATAQPYRSAYSEGERATAEELGSRLQALGYNVHRQEVSSDQGRGENLIVRIPGRGFHLEPAKATDVAGAPDSNLPQGDFRRLIVVGASYGTPVSADQASNLPDYDGVSDNASGTAALLLLARELKDSRPAFDVELVFFAGASDQQRGAQTYVQALSEEDRANFLVYIDLASLYAGDKLYANAGPSAGGKEDRRRLRSPLYALLDVSVSYYTGLRLLSNQAGFPVEDPAFSGRPAYREFTLKKGAYTPFDSAGLPIIAIESGDYAVDQVEAFRDSKNPKFSQSKGQIRGTHFDAFSVLKELLPEKQLQERINAVVFWLVKYIQNGLYYATEKE